MHARLALFPILFAIGFMIVVIVAAVAAARRQRARGLGGVGAVIAVVSALGLFVLVVAVYLVRAGVSEQVVVATRTQEQRVLADVRAAQKAQAWERAGVFQPLPQDKAWMAGKLDRHEFAGFSGMEPEPKIARESAREDLIGKIRAHLIEKLDEKGETHPDGPQIAGFKARELALSSQGTRDEHQDRFTLPKSDTIAHRAAFYVKLPDSWCSGTVRAIRKELEAVGEKEAAKRQTFAWNTVTLAFLALVVLLLYFFLNAGTKGHLAWPLRIASLAAYLLLCTGYVWMRGMSW